MTVDNYRPVVGKMVVQVQHILMVDLAMIRVVQPKEDCDEDGKKRHLKKAVVTVSAAIAQVHSQSEKEDMKNHSPSPC